MISVVTPSVRVKGLGMVEKSLLRQTYKNFEWIVVSPRECPTWIQSPDLNLVWIPDPPKKPGDYYGLNKAWNEAFRRCRGELVVSIVDLLWFPPDTLERLWAHYQANPKACIGAVGHQYDQIISGKPENKVWSDPRVRSGEYFYQIPPIDMELCIASIPRKAIEDVGGVDENFDRYAALSEKEMNMRIEQLGYTFHIDQSIEYRAFRHERLSLEWDEKYRQGIGYFNQCVYEIKQGKRLKLDNLVEKRYIKNNGSSEKETPSS